MHRRPVALLFAFALGACQQSTPSNESGVNQSQNTTVSLGNGNTVASTAGNGNLPASSGNSNVTANANQPAQATGTSATFDANGVQFLGRVATASSLITWSGSGITASFTGTSAQLSFTPQTGNTYLGISVDGGNFNRVLLTANMPISTGTLRSGTHTVTAIKLDEPSLGTAVFNGISTQNGTNSTTPLSRRIEFIGDSITVGYGIDGVSPCTNTSALENASETYGALTAGALNAGYDLIAWSGKGLTRNAASVATDTSPIMPVLWTRLAATDATSLYDFPSSRTPDAVVVNLGTNDFTYIGYDASGNSSVVRPMLDPNAYISAYVAFLTSVRKAYPNAFIELCSSPMLSDSYPTAAEAQHTTQLTALRTVMTQMADAKINVLDFPTESVGSGINGCDSHPSTTQHATMAKLLTAQLKTDLGW